MPGFEILGHFGDVNPTEFGGGVVFTDGTDVYAEYTYGAEIDEPDSHPDDLSVKLPVYLVELYNSGEDFLAWYDWVNWKNVEDMGSYKIGSASELDVPMARLAALEAAAGTYGWYEFDQAPSSTTIGDILSFWFPEEEI